MAKSSKAIFAVISVLVIITVIIAIVFGVVKSNSGSKSTPSKAPISMSLMSKNENPKETFVQSRNMGLMRNLELTPWYCENEFQCCMKNDTSHYDPVERSAHSLGRTLRGNYAIQPYNTWDFPTTPDERIRYQKCELRRRLCRMGRLNNYSDILMRGLENSAP